MRKKDEWMKKCPYCAEEIQDEAIICRYCLKRVKWRYNRLITVTIVMTALLLFANIHKGEFLKFTRDVKVFFDDVCILIRSLPQGIRAISDYNKRIRYTNQILDNEPPEAE